MEKVIRKYTNGDITVVWQPDLCIHAALCWKAEDGLPQVFNPEKRPWVDMKQGTSEQIMKQVDKCPSGALRYYRNEDTTPDRHSDLETEPENRVEMVRNGPLLVHGNIIVKDPSGNETIGKNVTAFCRCGASERKPFCDGKHTSIHFKD